MTTIIELLEKELSQEAETTRKMLARIPDDKYDWQPHEKSMTVRRLATHIADIPTWVDMALTTDELDFANTTHKEPVINSTSELLKFLEESVSKGGSALTNAKEDQLGQEMDHAQRRPGLFSFNERRGDPDGLQPDHSPSRTIGSLPEIA